MRIGSSPQHPPVATLHDAPTQISGESPIFYQPAARLDSIDLLRGLVMVIMALDHVRDFFSESHFDPLDLSLTTVPLALTRLITHFCAPVFVFLAGTGAYLSLTRGKSRNELSWFLLTRGAWLVVLEMSFVRFGWLFELTYALSVFQVIWVIGFSMMVLAALVYLRSRIVGAIGVLMILSHNLLDGIQASSFGALGWAWQILHTGGPVEFAPGHILLVIYPLIPWIGVLAAGFGFGEVVVLPHERRNKVFLRLGIGLTAAFVILRLSNLYGDPLPWSAQSSFGLSVISFLNCEKYPPSLLYLLMTLGPAIAILPALERARGWISRFFITFGRVPLFYYVIHIPFIHLLAIGYSAVAIHQTDFLTSGGLPGQWPDAYGVSLPWVYGVWISTVVILYFPSRWYADVKKRKRSRWMSYL
jgi:uncharacterized membrane protein